MSQAHVPLLSQLESDLIGGQPTADILRKLIVLGGRAESSELRNWASQELRGYADDSSLPEYRKVQAIIQMDSLVGSMQVSRQTIGPEAFPKEIREQITTEVSFRQGIAEIQSMIKACGEDQSIRLGLPAETMLMRIMSRGSNGARQVTGLYWTVSITVLEGMVDQVKTRLAELLGELRAATPPNREVPTPAETTNAVNIVINGRGNSVQVAHATLGATRGGLWKSEISDAEVLPGVVGPEHVLRPPFWRIYAELLSGLTPHPPTSAHARNETEVLCLRRLKLLRCLVSQGVSPPHPEDVPYSVAFCMDARFRSQRERKFHR